MVAPVYSVFEDTAGSAVVSITSEPSVCCRGLIFPAESRNIGFRAPVGSSPYASRPSTIEGTCLNIDITVVPSGLVKWIDCVPSSVNSIDLKTEPLTKPGLGLPSSLSQSRKSGGSSRKVWSLMGNIQQLGQQIKQVTAVRIVGEVSRLLGLPVLESPLISWFSPKGGYHRKRVSGCSRTLGGGVRVRCCS